MRSAAFIVFCLALGFASAGTSRADGATDSPPVINVRDFGAIGDGAIHRVTEWIDAGRYRNLRGVQRDHPFVDDLQWTIDEVAFEHAKRSLPVSGGTLYFPAGHYVAGNNGWRIFRNRVRLLGDGSDKSILSTAPNVPEGLILSPYRHVGWLEGASREYPFESASGQRGSDRLALATDAWSREFKIGELVFIRNGANRFDQDYGEFNEISGTNADGSLSFKYPLSRDYTLARFNWAAEVAEEAAMPEPGAVLNVNVRTGEGYFQPAPGATVTMNENIFRVKSVSANTLRLENTGRANSPRGTVIPAGTKIGKSRAVIKLTRSSRDFRCEKLQIVGRRKVLNLSNSYDLAFSDCEFRRDNRDSKFRGGLTIDGDGGRFARFERSTLIADPAAGMQFARSFGNVVFEDCRFVNANVAFTEFNFDCEVTRCTFEVEGTTNLTNVIIAGKSCGDLRVVANHIQASGVQTIFDTYSDIHSQKHGSEGDVLVRDNIIDTIKGVRVFTFPQSPRVRLENNTINQQ